MASRWDPTFRSRGRSENRGRALAVLTAALGIVVVLAALAVAAEVATAEVDGDANNVTIEQGSTVAFSVRVGASGELRCSATPENPATATLPLTYSIDAAGSVTGSGIGEPVRFFGVGSGTCYTTWSSDPVPQTTTVRVSADLFAPLGNHTVRLRPTLSTPSGSGAVLRDDTPTFLTFTVVPGGDQEVPDVACDGPHGAAGANGWHLEPVTYACTASDDGSGLADASDAAFTLSTDGEGTGTTDARTVTDGAGNGTTVGPFGPFDVDLHDPIVSMSWPSEGEQIILASAASAVSSCIDTPDGSGIASCVTTAMDTASVGTHSITTTAMDHAGRATVLTRSYSVVYRVDDLMISGGHETYQPGSTLVVRWSMGGITDPGALRSARTASASCGSAGQAEPIEIEAIDGATAKYDAGSDRFKMNWKTNKTWRGCRQLRLSFDDDTVRTMTVQFA